MDLAAGAIGSLLPKLVELLKEEYGLHKDARKAIESLLRELESAYAVLREIGDVPPYELDVDELVRLWARDVREASYDMEDALDALFLVPIGGPEPTETSLQEKVGKLFQKSKARRNLSTQIHGIYEKVDKLAAKRDRYGLDSFVAKPVGATSIDPRNATRYIRATDLVGIEGPRDELISMLSVGGDVDMSNKKIKIVSVTGSGGLGKTTLAKAVYDQLKPGFDCGAFIPVGRNPDMMKVFKDILINLDKKRYANYSDLNVLDVKKLMEKLKEFVEKKRYEYNRRPNAAR